MSEREFNNNEYVWWNNEGWLYLGRGVNGVIHLYRPTQYGQTIGFEQINEEDLEDFYHENGEIK